MIFFQLENLLLFVAFERTKHYTLCMTMFSYRRLIDTILLPFFVGSLFFLLLLSPLIYYSFDSNFHTEYMMHQWIVMSDSSSKHVQNVYMFIQWKSSLDIDFPLAERSHMEDVKKLFDLAYLIEIVSGVIFLSILFIFLFQKKYPRIIKWLFRGSLITLVVFFLIISVLFINFDTTFNAFHTIFFPQGNRSFAESSILISLFPANFFEAIATKIFSVGGGISLFIFIFSLSVIMYLKKNHR